MASTSLTIRPLWIALFVVLALALPKTSFAVTCTAAGDAANFAAIAATTVTNSGASVIVGDIGTSAGTSITGFSSAIVTGTVHDAPANDAPSALAIASAGTTYNCAANRPCTVDLTSNGSFGNQTLLGGVYCFSGSASIAGSSVLTLDGNGDSDSLWIFKMGSSFTASAYSSVDMVRSGLAGNVFWVVGSSADIENSATMVGTVMAYSSISMKTSSVLNGRAMALNGAVTLVDSSITIQDCSVTLCTTPASEAPSPNTVPSPVSVTPTLVPTFVPITIPVPRSTPSGAPGFAPPTGAAPTSTSPAIPAPSSTATSLTSQLSIVLVCATLFMLALY